MENLYFIPRNNLEDDMLDVVREENKSLYKNEKLIPYSSLKEELKKHPNWKLVKEILLLEMTKEEVDNMYNDGFTIWC